MNMWDYPDDEKIGVIREMFLDMKMKFKTDPFLEPKKSLYQLKEPMNTLSDLEKQHTKTAREVDLEALCTDMELPRSILVFIIIS